MYINKFTGGNMNTAVYTPEWVREDFVDFVAEKFHPTWAWKKVKAELVSKRALSQDFHEFILRPNHNFDASKFQAGQSLLVTVVVKGVRQQRSYSIINIDEYGIHIAVKQQGVVSNALAAMPIHSVIEISQVQGEFTLNTPSTEPVLLIASGSGITAIYSLLKHALKQNQSIEMIYFSRDSAYHHEIESLHQQFQNFTYHLIDTSKTKLHFSEKLLKHLVPDFESRMCYACGTAGMMQDLHALYESTERQNQLKTEYFQLTIDPTLKAQQVTFARAQQTFMADASLLESAEKAGLKPAHGCRIGICNTCSCTKVQGAVRNVLTGEIDQGNNTQIKLCISQAISPVVINL